MGHLVRFLLGARGSIILTHKDSIVTLLEAVSLRKFDAKNDTKIRREKEMFLSFWLLSFTWNYSSQYFDVSLVYFKSEIN